MSMRVVNKRTHQPTSFDVYVGRPSVLGNSFRIGRDGDRDQVIERYRRWLWQAIKARNAPVISALITLDPDAVLVCWCAPEPCHADVIIRAYDWLMQQPVQTGF
jgi:hypothetical protein